MSKTKTKKNARPGWRLTNDKVFFREIREYMEATGARAVRQAPAGEVAS